MLVLSVHHCFCIQYLIPYLIFKMLNDDNHGYTILVLYIRNNIYNKKIRFTQKMNSYRLDPTLQTLTI